MLALLPPIHSDCISGSTEAEPIWAGIAALLGTQSGGSDKSVPKTLLLSTSSRKGNSTVGAATDAF